MLRSLLDDGHDLALAPQTLAEFLHVVTDGKRMPSPLPMSEALQRAEHWWQAAEVIRVFPDGPSVTEFLAWIRRHALGRKRLLDTMLAALMAQAGVTRIVTNNGQDFRGFSRFEIVPFRGD